MDSPIPWEVLARLQSKSNPRTTHAWALAREEAFEATLDDLLNHRILPEAQVIERRFDHRCANRATKHRRRDRLLRGWGRRLCPANFHPSDRLMTQESVACVRSALPAVDFCCLLELAEGHSYADVADRHGLNEGNLKSRVCRARARVRKDLTERYTARSREMERAKTVTRSN